MPTNNKIRLYAVGDEVILDTDKIINKLTDASHGSDYYKRIINILKDYNNKAVTISEVSKGYIISEFKDIQKHFNLIITAQDIIKCTKKNIIGHLEQYYNSIDSKELSRYATNMNLEYLNGKYDKCVCRDNEICRIGEILLRKNKSNPVLIGKAGVGKTAIVEGMVAQITEIKKRSLSNKRLQNHPLVDKIVYNVSLNSLIAGTRYRGEFEERLEKIIEVAKNNKNVILFIDEIHMVVGLNGSGEAGTVSTSQYLKQPFSRGEISVIGATTTDEYKIITSDKALERRFAPVQVNEFSAKSMKGLLPTIRKTYSDFHNANISEEIMEKTLQNCEIAYSGSKTYPDKLIDIIDETMARVRLHNPTKKKITISINDINKTIFNQTGKIIVDNSKEE